MFHKLRSVCLLSCVICSNSLFSAAVTGVNPLVGPRAGGTAVTITGSGFSGATQVQFGPTPAASFIVNSDTSITAVSPVSVPSNVDIIVTAPSGVSTTNSTDIFTFQGGWFAYVGSPSITSGGVGPIDLTTNTAQPKIPVGAGAAPLDVEITPDNRTAITADIANDRLVFIDLATSTVVSNIPLVGTGAQFLAIAPDGTVAYVACATSDSIDVVDIINPAHPITSIALSAGSQPQTPVFAPDGKRAYVLNTGNNTVTVLDTTTKTIVTTIAVGPSVTDMVATPDGQYLLISRAGANTLVVVATATNTVVQSIMAGASPSCVAVTPDGLRAYVGNFGSNSLTRINLTTFVAEATINGILRPNGIFVTPDNKTAYVSNSVAVGSVTPVDLTTNPEMVLAPIPGFRFPVAISITPDQSPVARFTVALAKTGLPSSFDASQSVSPVGTVVSYAWDFGDGTAVTTASPTVSHTYQKAGHFKATLTVTNSAGTSTTEVFSGRTAARNGSSYFAVRDQSLEVALPAPFKFVGEIHKHKGKLKLHTSWKKPASSDVSRYEIFADGERIANIRINHHRRFVKFLHPKNFFKEHLHDYKKFLQKRYKIRAVNSDGITSNFTHLKIRKSS